MQRDTLQAPFYAVIYCFLNYCDVAYWKHNRFICWQQIEHCSWGLKKKNNNRLKATSFAVFYLNLINPVQHKLMWFKIFYWWASGCQPRSTWSGINLPHYPDLKLPFWRCHDATKPFFKGVLHQSALFHYSTGVCSSIIKWKVYFRISEQETGAKTFYFCKLLSIFSLPFKTLKSLVVVCLRARALLYLATMQMTFQWKAVGVAFEGSECSALW